METRTKRIISIILTLALLATVCIVPMSATATEVTGKRPLKILALGNSYTNNATEYISRIAESMGLEIKAASLYKDGCMIQGHLERYEAYEKLGHDAYYASSNSIKYIHLNVNGVADTSILSMQEAIASDDWDFIVLQQAPNSCDKIEKYWTEENPDVVTLYNYVQAELTKNNNSKCEILLHQPWSFSHEMSIDNNYQWYPVDYENTRDFFLKIEETVDQAAKIVQREKGLDAPLDIIPAGEAMQLAKDEFSFGDTYNNTNSLYADFISHLSNPIGRYMIACLWIEKMTANAGFPVDCRTATYLPSGLSEEQAAILRSIAHEVVSGETDSIYGDWRAVPEGDGLKITHYEGEVPASGTISIPATLGGKKVKKIGISTFKYVDGVTSVVFESDSVRVEEGALDGLTEIASLWGGTSVKPSKGSGTSAADPMLITNAAELYWAVMNENAGVYFKLTNDIYINDIKVDAANGTVQGAENALKWIDKESTTIFKGIIDGDNHVVNGLYIDASFNTGSTWNGGVGLIPNGACTVKNLGVVNSYVNSANSAAAAFIGSTKNSKETSWGFENCFVGSDVYIHGAAAAGFFAGGSGEYVTKGNVLFKDCYTLANISGSTTWVGAFTGQVWTATNNIAKNCYATMKFYGQGSLTYQNCYSTVASGTGVTVLTAANMQGANSALKMSSLYEAYVVTDGYPVLKSFSGRNNGEWSGFRVSTMQGSGTDTDPYQVATPENLAYVAFGGFVKDKYYKLTSDIYLNDITKFDYVTGKVAEGYTALEWQEGKTFTAKFDGDGHIVYGMWYPADNNLNTTAYVTAGLFGTLGTNTVIKNLGVKNSYIETIGYAGAIASFVTGLADSNILIDSCFADETVTVYTRSTTAVPNGVGSAGILGGVLVTGNLTISNCYSLANITGNYSKGKILASIWECKGGVIIENCFGDGQLCGGSNNLNSVNSIVNSYANAAPGTYKTWTQITESEMKGAKALLRMPNLGSAFIAQYKDYPTLKVFAKGAVEPDTSYWDGALIAPTKGSGTAAAPYLISTPEEFAYVINAGGAENTFYKLTSDIYLNKLDKINWTNGELLDENYVVNEWFTGTNMVGNVYTNGTSEIAFTGTFDGDGYSVYGVYYTPGQPGTCAGLFPAVKTATIKNISLKTSFISGGRWTGAIIGSAGTQGITLTVDKAIADESVTVWGYNAGGYYYDGRVREEPIYAASPFGSWQSISGPVDFESHAIGGVVASVTNNSTVTITNCLITANLYGDKCTTQYSNEYANGGKPYTVGKCGTIFGVMGTCWNPKQLTFQNNITYRSPINNNNGVLVSSDKTLLLTMENCYYVENTSNREGAIQLTVEQLTGADALTNASGLSDDVWYAVKAEGKYPSLRVIGMNIGDVNEDGVFEKDSDTAALRGVIIGNVQNSNGDEDRNNTVNILDLVKFTLER